MVAIMELARKSETKKVVFASSSSLYNGVSGQGLLYRGTAGH